jgi:hypothetical protein
LIEHSGRARLCTKGWWCAVFSSSRRRRRQGSEKSFFLLASLEKKGIHRLFSKRRVCLFSELKAFSVCTCAYTCDF